MEIKSQVSFVINTLIRTNFEVQIMNTDDDVLLSIDNQVRFQTRNMISIPVHLEIMNRSVTDCVPLMTEVDLWFP